MEIILLVMMIIILIGFTLVYRSIRKPSNTIDINWDKLEKINNLSIEKTNEKIIMLGEKLTSSSDMSVSKIEAILLKNNDGLKKEFGTLQTTMITGMSDNKASINKDINEFKEKLILSQSESIEKLINEFRSIKDSLIEGLTSNKEEITKGVIEFKESLNKALKDDFDALINKVESKLDKIDDKVKESLEKGFKKTNETFLNVVERLTKIDEAQKKIKELSQNVVNLQNVLTDKKTRGIFGEVQLGHILSQIFGDKNDDLYKQQYKLSNGTIVDSILFLPDPIGKLGIDSKFPLENYEKMYSIDLSDSEKEIAKKSFKNDLKKHIDAISSKYIIAGETSEQSIMFIPAEAIFAEVNAHHPDIVNYAQQKRIWLTSPTTLMSMLTIVQVTNTEAKRSKYMGVIHEHLNKLGEEFERYRKRWDGINKHIDQVSKDVKEINVTTEKISNKFETIKNVDVNSNALIEANQLTLR